MRNQNGEADMAKKLPGMAETPRMVAGRQQFLIYMDPDLVVEVKLEARERGISASDIVEEAVRQRKRLGKRSRKSDSSSHRRK